MISIRVTGSFKKTEKYFAKLKDLQILKSLSKYGQDGVNALASATPVDTGKTAASWTYEVRRSEKSFSIIWKNSNIQNGVPIAIILQYGHGTRNGGYVQGRDYINPAIRPIFDQISNDAWEEVRRY